MRKISYLVVLFFIAFLHLSCGYTTSSLLPSHLKTVHVESFENNIVFTTERGRNLYFPLLEVKARDAIIERYLFDGNLKIAKEGEANLVLSGALVNYHRQALRYDDNDDPEEYRVQIVVNMQLWDTVKDEAMWEENGFVGEADYFVSGALATTEESAVEEATTDLARRIVERTIENW